jgi:ubiquinone/menaquinone biosynthesis C-methylase UbiE
MDRTRSASSTASVSKAAAWPRISAAERARRCPGFRVVGLDASASQLAIAEQRCTALGLTNVTFVEADVYSTGLPRNTFDVVHCRLLLCHLQRPEAAIREMADITRPGGTVVCCDIDMHELYTLPRTAPFERLREIYLRRRHMDGLDNHLASRLPALLSAAGLRDLEMAFIQPVAFRGEEKRLWEYTFAESAERTLEKGLVTETELDALLEAVREVSRDDQVGVVQARLPVCWARKPTR